MSFQSYHQPWYRINTVAGLHNSIFCRLPSEMRVAAVRTQFSVQDAGLHCIQYAAGLDAVGDGDFERPPGMNRDEYCRNLIKKPWAFIRVPFMNPTILGVIGPGFLNQVPTVLAQDPRLAVPAAVLRGPLADARCACRFRGFERRTACAPREGGCGDCTAARPRLCARLPATCEPRVATRPGGEVLQPLLEPPLLQRSLLHGALGGRNQKVHVKLRDHPAVKLGLWVYIGMFGV